MKKIVSRIFAFVFAFIMVVTSCQVRMLAFSGYEEKILAPGSYVGKGEGYGGELLVSVSVNSTGDVYGIQVVSSNETPRFFEKAKAIIDTIIEKQSVDVDAVSSATYTSNAIKQAVKNALDQAVIGFAAGDGSIDNPYQISNKEGLLYLRDEVENGNSFSNQYIILTNKIDLSGETWTPIGNDKKSFAGHFDGKNFEIKGMNISGNVQYAGLFGYALNGATFKNIVMTDVNIDTECSAVGYAGAVIGYLKVDSKSADVSVVDHCKADGNIAVSTNNQSAMVGGLIGFGNQACAITNNESNVSVAVSSGSKVANVGGIVGMTSIKELIMNNISTKTVSLISTNANANVGGIAGSLNGIVCNNVSTSVVQKEGGRAGGLCGNIAAACYVTNSYHISESAFGNISGKYDSQTVITKTIEEIMEDSFAQVMHDNISAASISVISEKVSQANISGCEDFSVLTGRIQNQFYDWEIEDGKLKISDSLWASTEADTSIFETGNGTKENPYIIQNETQLRAFATSLTAKMDYTGKYIKLGDNIEVDSDVKWVPVGEGEYAFQGNFDGAGFEISGISIGSKVSPYMDNGEVYYGFFGVTGENAYIHNLKLDEDIYVQSGASIYVGGLSGYVEKTKIDGVTVSGNIGGTSGNKKYQANHFSGGIAGQIYRATISNSVNNANIFAGAKGGIAEAGGIAGINNRSLVINCLSTGKIEGTADRALEGMAALGGICGVHAGTMVNCLSASDIYSETYSQYVGALAGWTTGIGNLYLNYYSKDAMLIIESQIVNPVVSVGWLVGPGVNDEGEPYDGSIEYKSIGLSGKELADANLVAIMNEGFGVFPIDLKDYPDMQLLSWIRLNDKVLPCGNVQAVTYVEPNIPKPVIKEKEVSGEFYGRSDDKKLILKVIEDKSVIVRIDIKKNEDNWNVDDALEKVISANSTETLADDEVSSSVKQAVDKAIDKMKKNDTTDYEKVDPTIFAEGDGSKENPYKIQNEKQLRSFAASINAEESFENCYLELSNDIELTQEWICAGSDNHYPFKGYFDGKGHSIKGLCIGSKENPKEQIYAGLFSYVEGAIVKNLKIVEPSIHIINNGSSRIYAGALAAFVDQRNSNGYVDQIIVERANVSVTTNSGAGYAAGLIGSAQYGNITNCSVTDAVISDCSKAQWCYAGALTAIVARSAVINNYVSGAVSADAPLNKAAIGGLAGFFSAAAYNNVSEVELISKGTTNDVGAIAGRETGIAFILDEYYYQDSLQKEGANTLVPGKGIGTIVNGENDGKGFCGKLTSLSKQTKPENQMLENLNLNTDSAKESLENLKEQVKQYWKVEYPSELLLLKWSTEPSISIQYLTNESEKKDDIDTNLPKDETDKQEENKKLDSDINTEGGNTNQKTQDINQNQTADQTEKTVLKLNAKTLVMQKGQVCKKLQVIQIQKNDTVQSWKSSNKKVVSVTKKGVLTAKRIGKATITVTTKNGAKATVKVTVKKAKVSTSKITIAKKNITIKKGKTIKLKPVVSPITSQDTISYRVVGDEKIAKVSKTGVVKAKKKGKITIFVISGKKKMKINVTVK